MGILFAVQIPGEFPVGHAAVNQIRNAVLHGSDEVRELTGHARDLIQGNERLWDAGDRRH